MLPDRDLAATDRPDLRAWGTAHVRSLPAAGALFHRAGPGISADRELNPVLRTTLTNSASQVPAVALTILPDGGPLLAVGSYDNAVRLWDPITGICHHTLTDHTGSVESVAFTVLPDGTPLLASGSVDHTVRIWDPSTGTLHRTLSESGAIYEVAFTVLPDGTPLLATAGGDGTVRLWDPLTGVCHQTLTGHTSRVYAAGFIPSRDGNDLLATGGSDHTVRIWDIATGRCHHTLTGHDDSVWTLRSALLPDGAALLASGGFDHTVRIWDPATGACHHTLADHANSVYGLTFITLPGGPTALVSASVDHTVRIWDPVTGSCLHTFPAESAAAWAVDRAVLPDGTLLLAAGYHDGTIRIWTMEAPGPTYPQEGWSVSLDPATVTLTGHHENVEPVARIGLPDGTSLLATGSKDRTVRVWNPVTGACLHTLTGHTGDTAAAALTVLADGTALLATGSNDETVRVWDPVTGTCLHTLTGHVGMVRSVTLITMPGGTVLLASGGNDNTVRIWDPTTGTLHHTLTDHTASIFSAAFVALPDGTVLLATGSDDHTVRVWDPVAGTCHHTLRHPLGVYAVALATLPDGAALLATGDADGTVRVWDPVTEACLHTLTGHASNVDVAAFVTLPGGTPLLVTGGDEGTLRFWDPLTGENVHTEEAGITCGWYSSENMAVWVDVAGGEGAGVSVAHAAGNVTVLRRFWIRAPGWGPGLGVSGRAARSASVEAAAAGLPGLAGAGVIAPLGLLADLVELTGPGTAPPAVAALADQPGIARLRGLGWPPAARAGLTALLLDGIPADPRYAAPDAPPVLLYRALRAALAAPAGGPAGHQPHPVAALMAACEQVSDQTMTLLCLLGPDAVAADPVLPLRMRHHESALPAIDPAALARLADIPRQARDTLDARAVSTRAAPATVGVHRHGKPVNLLRSQLALPNDLFTIRLATSDLLYRLYEGNPQPVLEPAVIILDTTPPTFGPVEATLRLTAHTLAATLLAAGQDAALITLDDPAAVKFVHRPADLMAIWTTRTLHPPALAPALSAAAALGYPATVVMTTHHLAAQHPLIARPQLRILTTHAPGETPRPTPSPYHLHLPPHPTPAQIAAATAALLSTTHDTR